nr:S8 family peptidase [uncultured Clostridium sp.]
MNKILDNNYYDLIISNRIISDYNTGDNVTPLNERYSLLHIPILSPEPCDLGTHPSNSFPSLYVLESTVSLEKSGISTVQQNPHLNLSGKGVLVGMIDTGIDYTHPAFQDPDGTSRIYSIWDQTIQEGTVPDGFTFGSEYKKEQINEALLSKQPLSVVPSADTNGHGTAMASIAAGSPSANRTFSGIVPSSELVIVKLKEAKNNLKNIFFVPEDAYCFQESDIYLGIRYILSVSEKAAKPVIICICLGSSQGGHDGNGAFSSYITAKIQDPGICFVVSAGNEGNKARHYYNNTTQIPWYNDFELKIGEKDKQFWMEIWPYASSRISIDISSPNRESTQRIYPSIRECRKFNFIFTQSILWVNNILFEEETGNQVILIRFKNPMPGVWYLRVQSIKEEPISFHCWLPNGSLLSNDTYFLNPDPSVTITSPGNGTHQLTVTAYNQFNDSVLPDASRGYTRTGMVKPDIAAPGFQLTCAVSGNLYGSAEGTGAAAAHAAGAAAMILEWGIVKGNYPTLTGYDINRMMMRAARHSPGNTYPNNQWGYGQLDISNVFKQLTNI